MAWQTHGNRRYYYRTRHDGDNARRICVGAGLVAELAAAQDYAVRQRQSEERQIQLAEQQRVQSTLKPLGDTCHTAEAGMPINRVRLFMPDTKPDLVPASEG